MNELHEVINDQKSLKPQILKLLFYPDPLLRIPSLVVPEEKLEDIKKIAELMIKTMEFYQGVGLSAVQVGLHYRLVVIASKETVHVLINPIIVKKSQETTLEMERCLSVPFGEGHVTRPVSLIVKYRDLNWEEQEKEFVGLEARCVEHEIEHLDGILFVDHLSSLRQDIIKRKMKKFKLNLKRISEYNQD